MQILKQLLLVKRTIELAWRATGRTLTNPRVGALIYDEKRQKIIGEGYHRAYGQNHAEINALKHCKDPANKSIFVSLEPCNHFGKTPPCTKAITASRLDKVYVDQLDPNPKMSGHSLALLRQRGINVAEPADTRSGHDTLLPFTIQQKYRRPYVIIKMAVSADGFISAKDQPVKISNTLSDRWVHRWRNESDAILVGANTLLTDNPRLTSRYHNLKNPIRVIIDQRNTIPPSLKVFKEQGHNIMFTKPTNVHFPNTKIIPTLDFSMNWIFSQLYQNNIGTLLVEGGTKLVNKIIEKNLWDEARIIQNASLKLNSGVSAPDFQGIGTIIARKNLGNDTIKFIKR